MMSPEVRGDGEPGRSPPPAQWWKICATCFAFRPPGCPLSENSTPPGRGSGGKPLPVYEAREPGRSRNPEQLCQRLEGIGLEVVDAVFP